jgi:hypothetical protein
MVVLALLLVIGMLASTSAFAAPVFAFDDDDQGANDEPGQKDLTAQASAVDQSAPNHFFTAWKWDDTSWSGNNTGDGCSLFDTNGDGFVEYAVCGTVEGGKGPAEVTFDTVTVYSCNNKWVNRCGGPEIEFGPSTDSSYCTVVDEAPGMFDTFDTQISCDITALAAAAGITIAPGTLLNTCSYPSQEPNSDPSDCVKTVTNVNTSVGTSSGGTTTWSATLNDTATMTPSNATGSVVFTLYSDAACSAANLVWTSPSINLDANGQATTAGGGSPNNGNTITNATVDGDGIYYWIVTYTPTGAFNSSASTCGEATTITPASVAGSTG